MHSKFTLLLSSATLATCVSALQPSFAADEYSQGAAAYTARDFAGAKTHLLKATKVKPKSWQAHYQLANTYVALKDSASAKASYQKCLANHPPADVQTNCTNALSYIATNPSLMPPVVAAPPRPVQMIRPKSYTETASSGTGEAPVNADLEMRRAKIIQEGEAEVNRMKVQEKERQTDAEANANQRYVYPDGTVKTALSSEEQAQMQREVEQKAAAIRERAKRRASDLR